MPTPDGSPIYILAHKSERITVRELRRTRDLFEEDTARIAPAAETLRKANWLGDMASSRGGDSRISWSVNPKVHALFAARAAIVAAEKKQASAAIAARAKRLKERGLV